MNEEVKSGVRKPVGFPDYMSRSEAPAAPDLLISGNDQPIPTAFD
jgi:hypothetical protein